MSQGTETQTKDPLLNRLDAQLNEDRLFKELSAVQLSRLKLLDEITEEVQSSGRIEEIRQVLTENLAEEPASLSSRYILGRLALLDGDDESRLRDLVKDFSRSAKWTIVDHIADHMLARDENSRAALRAKVETTERLKGKKELAPYLERLANIDRKNPDILRKYALSILETEPERALGFLKSAAETYARLKDYKNLEEIWNLVIQHDHEDLPFFERIERILAGNREKTRIAAYLVALVAPYRQEENWDAIITILKKILEYEPTSSRARSDLVRAYRSRYENHSLLNEFLKMSDLTNHKKPVGPCIASFERNIVFDKGNYVYHRTRGVGRIQVIDSDEVIVDFHGNPGQRMSIQMAITSLQPLTSDHIWVRYYEKPEEVTEVFNNDVPLFFEILLSSFNNSMVLSEIKTEVVPRFLTIEEWSRWWSRARTQLKKDPKFGFNPRKKDELILREIPMTLSEELSMKFQSETEWEKKLDLALETLKDESTAGATELAIQFYRENEENKDALKRLHSYLFLEFASHVLDEDIAERTLKKSDAEKLIREASEKTLLGWSKDTTQVELKKEFVSLIIRNRDDYPQILTDILFEVPIKIHRFVISELARLKQFETLEKFVERVFRRYREHPETLIWIARSVLTGQWDYAWIKRSRQEILLLVFRLLKPLVRIEKKGTRLKNSAIETISGTTNITVDHLQKAEHLVEIVKEADPSVLRRMYALFREVPYAADAHKENFFRFIQTLRPEFTMDYDAAEEADLDSDEEEAAEDLMPGAGEILCSRDAIEKRKLYLDRLINVEMPANSREIGEAQEKGDLRENAEYKAAMERQSQIQAEIKTVSEEVKRARAIRPADVRTDVVGVGSAVTVSAPGGEKISYRILGPWDADTENHVISYASPLARALIGKKAGETAILDGDKQFQIEEIGSAF